MSNKYFEVEFTTEKIKKFLLEVSKNIADMTPLMKTAAVFMKDCVDENFETEGTHTGEKWEAWSEAWKKQRIKQGRGSGKILSLDGHLRKSIMSKTTFDSAIVGTNKIYAAIHNFGGTPELKRNKTMPKREFNRINDDEEENMFEELTNNLEELIEKNHL